MAEDVVFETLSEIDRPKSHSDEPEQAGGGWGIGAAFQRIKGTGDRMLHSLHGPPELKDTPPTSVSSHGGHSFADPRNSPKERQGSFWSNLKENKKSNDDEESDKTPQKQQGLFGGFLGKQPSSIDESDYDTDVSADIWQQEPATTNRPPIKAVPLLNRPPKSLLAHKEEPEPDHDDDNDPLDQDSSHHKKNHDLSAVKSSHPEPSLFQRNRKSLPGHQLTPEIQDHQIESKIDDPTVASASIMKDESFNDSFNSFASDSGDVMSREESVARGLGAFLDQRTQEAREEELKTYTQALQPIEDKSVAEFSAISGSTGLQPSDARLRHMMDHIDDNSLFGSKSCVTSLNPEEIQTKERRPWRNHRQLRRGSALGAMPSSNADMLGNMASDEDDNDDDDLLYTIQADLDRGLDRGIRRASFVDAWAEDKVKPKLSAAVTAAAWKAKSESNSTSPVPANANNNATSTSVLPDIASPNSNPPVLFPQSASPSVDERRPSDPVSLLDDSKEGGDRKKKTRRSSRRGSSSAPDSAKQKDDKITDRVDLFALQSFGGEEPAKRKNEHRRRSNDSEAKESDVNVDQSSKRNKEKPLHEKASLSVTDREKDATKTRRSKEHRRRSNESEDGKATSRISEGVEEGSMVNSATETGSALSKDVEHPSRGGDTDGDKRDRKSSRKTSRREVDFAVDGKKPDEDSGEVEASETAGNEMNESRRHRKSRRSHRPSDDPDREERRRIRKQRSSSRDELEDSRKESVDRSSIRGELDNSRKERSDHSSSHDELNDSSKQRKLRKSSLREGRSIPKDPHSSKSSLEGSVNTGDNVDTLESGELDGSRRRRKSSRRHREGEEGSSRRRHRRRDHPEDLQQDRMEDPNSDSRRKSKHREDYQINLNDEDNRNDLKESRRRMKSESRSRSPIAEGATLQESRTSPYETKPWRRQTPESSRSLGDTEKHENTALSRLEARSRAAAETPSQSNQAETRTSRAEPNQPASKTSRAESNRGSSVSVRDNDGGVERRVEQPPKKRLGDSLLSVLGLKKLTSHAKLGEDMDENASLLKQDDEDQKPRRLLSGGGFTKKTSDDSSGRSSSVARPSRSGRSPTNDGRSHSMDPNEQVPLESCSDRGSKHRKKHKESRRSTGVPTRHTSLPVATTKMNGDDVPKD